MPNRLTITINLDNDAFHPDPVPELEWTLKTQVNRIALEQMIDRYNEPLPIRDSNGNTVGTFLWETE